MTALARPVLRRRRLELDTKTMLKFSFLPFLEKSGLSPSPNEKLLYFLVAQTKTLTQGIVRVSLFLKMSIALDPYRVSDKYQEDV